MCFRLHFLRERLAMDVLDQLLADIRHESCVFCRLDATEPFRISKGPSTVAPFYAVLSGNARIETANDAYDLAEGDFLVLPGGQPHELTGVDSATAPTVPLLSLLAPAGAEPWRPGVRYRKTVHLQHGGGGSPSVLLIGIFSFGNPRRNPLLTALPPVLVIRSGTDRNKAWLKMTVNAIAEELAAEQPGSNLVIAKLADLLFMQALRAFLATDLQKTATCSFNEYSPPMPGERFEQTSRVLPAIIAGNTSSIPFAYIASSTEFVWTT
jgi:hypothetical protein